MSRPVGSNFIKVVALIPVGRRGRSETHAVLQESCAHFDAASTPVRLYAFSGFLAWLQAKEQTCATSVLAADDVSSLDATQDRSTVTTQMRTRRLLCVKRRSIGNTRQWLTSATPNVHSTSMRQDPARPVAGDVALSLQASTPNRHRLPLDTQSPTDKAVLLRSSMARIRHKYTVTRPQVGSHLGSRWRAEVVMPLTMRRYSRLVMAQFGV